MQTTKTVLKSMDNYGIICHMSEEPEKKVNIDSEDVETQGLDQDKFADLFDSLDEETLMKMMESAGLFSDDADVSPEEEPAETASGEEPLVIEWLDPDATDVSTEAVADKDAMLSPEHIGHMLSVLGDDIIGDMLESAGLSDEDVDAVLAEAKAESEAAETEKGMAAPDAGKSPAPPGKRRKGRNVRRLLFVLIFIGILGLVAAVNKIYNSVTINSNDPIQYSENTDMISADEGTLHVNNVNVTVPTDGTEEYSISYSWAENDNKYPSVPHAISAIYSRRAETDAEAETAESAGTDSAADKDTAADEKAADTEEKESAAKEDADADNEESAAEEKAADTKKDSSADEEKTADAEEQEAAVEEEASDAEQESAAEEEPAEKIYSITLYRNETTPTRKIEKGKNVSNWFNDWTVVNEGDVLQIPLKSGSINGFYIFPQPPSDNGPSSDYNDFSYYFAVKNDDGISTYVIEGVCLDPEYDAAFRSIMDNCIHSISIDSEDNKDKDNDSEDSDSEDSE